MARPKFTTGQWVTTDPQALSPEERRRLEDREAQERRRHHMATQLVPQPEIVSGGQWVFDVRGTTGVPRMKFKPPMLEVPMAPTDQNRAIQRHELAHVRWSPKVAPIELARRWGVRPEYVLACEDMRVNRGLELHGLGFTHTVHPDPEMVFPEHAKVVLEQLQAASKVGLLAPFVSFCVASIGYPGWTNMHETLLNLASNRWSRGFRKPRGLVLTDMDRILARSAASAMRVLANHRERMTRGSWPRTDDDHLSQLKELAQTLQVLHHLMDKAVAKYQAAKAAAERTSEGTTLADATMKAAKAAMGETAAKLLADSTVAKHRMAGMELSDKAAHAAAAAHEAMRAGTFDTRMVREAMDDLMDEEGRLADGGGGEAPDESAYGEGGKPSDAVWGRMKVVQPPMLVKAKRSLAFDRRGTNSTDEGAMLRYPHRFLIDQRIFKRPKRKEAGTVLIDGSGSMGLSMEALQEMLDQCPALTVAMYSGRRDYGELVILAHRGRRVREIPHRLGGNVVDGPALQWLAQQPEPRIWISDGGVTGPNDAGFAGLREFCAELLKRHRMIMVPNVQMARDMMAKRSR